MDLAALDRRVAPEATPDRLGERLRAVDDEQTRHRRIEAALDQVVDQRLHHSAVLGCPFHQPKRVLEALAIDPERRHQHEMLTDMDTVDLHHHDVDGGQDRTHPVPAPDNPTKRREAADSETPAPAGAGTSPSGSRTARRNFRVETLISIRFIAHLPSQSSATARSQLGSTSSWPARSRTRGRSTATLPA